MIITARVRSTTGRLCFVTCLSVCPQGGVSQPTQPRGGGGVKSSWGGSGPAGRGGQVQPAGGGGGGQVQPAGRGGQVQLGGGSASGGGGSAMIGQHREYLLHGGQYASCVHAGGLSCLAIVLKRNVNKWAFLLVIVRFHLGKNENVFNDKNRKSPNLITNKKVLLRETARGIPPAA